MATLRGLMVPRHRHDASTDGIGTTRAVSLQVIEFTAFLGQEVSARLGEFGFTAKSPGAPAHCLPLTPSLSRPDSKRQVGLNRPSSIIFTCQVASSFGRGL